MEQFITNIFVGGGVDYRSWQRINTFLLKLIKGYEYDKIDIIQGAEIDIKWKSVLNVMSPELLSQIFVVVGWWWLEVQKYFCF